MKFVNRFHAINHKKLKIKGKMEKIFSTLREMTDEINDIDRLYKEELEK